MNFINNLSHFWGTKLRPWKSSFGPTTRKHSGRREALKLTLQLTPVLRATFILDGLRYLCFVTFRFFSNGRHGILQQTCRKYQKLKVILYYSDLYLSECVAQAMNKKKMYSSTQTKQFLE